jgi:hypothetical protein
MDKATGGKTMKRSSMVGSAALAIGVAFSAPAQAQVHDLGLVTELAGLGVTTSQASGGLLAIMQLAQTNLGPADFGKLMGMLPEIGDFMGTAGGGAAAAGAMGAAAGAMGAAAAETSTEEAGHDAEHEAHAAEHEAADAEHEAHAAEHEAADAEHEAHAVAPEEGCCGGEMGGDAGAMAGAAGAMGGAAGGMPQITGLSELAAVPSLVSAFSGLGLGPEMIQQFVPIILKYVMGSGGSAAAQLLGTGLGLGLM